VEAVCTLQRLIGRRQHISHGSLCTATLTANTITYHTLEITPYIWMNGAASIDGVQLCSDAEYGREDPRTTFDRGSSRRVNGAVARATYHPHYQHRLQGGASRSPRM